MLRAIYTAAAGMVSQQIKQEYISHNLANVGTPGFKKQTVALGSFKDMLVHHIGTIGDRSMVGPPLGTVSLGTKVEEAAVSWEQGALEPTGRPLDLALLGSGFFTVQAEKGIRFTRNGSLQRDAKGFLVTRQGYRILGTNGPVRLDTDQFQIYEDGSIVVGGQTINRLIIADFPDAKSLLDEGDGMFAAGPQVRPVPGKARVKQGVLEKANVNLITEMANMLMTMRVYEGNQRVIQALDETLAKSVNEIGSIG